MWIFRNHVIGEYPVEKIVDSITFWYLIRKVFDNEMQKQMLRKSLVIAPTGWIVLEIAACERIYGIHTNKSIKDKIRALIARFRPAICSASKNSLNNAKKTYNRKCELYMQAMQRSNRRHISLKNAADLKKNWLIIEQKVLSDINVVPNPNKSLLTMYMLHWEPVAIL